MDSTGTKAATPAETIARLTAENESLRRQLGGLEASRRLVAALEIRLPDGFKARIRKYLADLDAALEREPARREALEIEITSLESARVQLANEVHLLHDQAALDEEAAGKLAAKESRLVHVNERLEELRETLAHLRPVTLQGAGQVVGDVVRFYAPRLESRVIYFLEPIAPEEGVARTMAKLCGAMRSLQHLASWAITLDSQPATLGNVAKVTEILNRALRGQPHLGADCPPGIPPVSEAGETTGETTEQRKTT